MPIEIDGLWKRFGRFDAVRGLSLSVPEGSVFAFIGANGAGKTTTIKTMMNIIQPDRGSVHVVGVDSRRLRAPEFTRIGYVSENQELPGRLSVKQFIDYLRPFYPGWDRALESALLNQTQLPARRKICDLSHGMRAKLTLVCALAFRPNLLVLDEPFSGLDPLVRDEFMAVLSTQSHGCTQFISSHELGEIDGIATHVGFIDRGVLLFQEPLADLRARIKGVRIVVEGEARLPTSLPPEWLDIRTAGSEVVFIETRFVDEESLRAKINVAFGPVLNLEIRAVELRSIFTTIARALRTKAN